VRGPGGFPPGVFFAHVSGAGAGAGNVENTPHRDVPGTPLCSDDHPAPRCVAHNGATGHSTGRAFQCTSPGSDRGRRRTSSVVADLPASHARPRCSCDAGTQRRHRRPCGPEGRDPQNPWPKPHPDPQTPRSTGTCRVRNCASTTNRRRGASRTIALPGTPRADRPSAPLPAQMEAAGARSAWSQPFSFPTDRPR